MEATHEEVMKVRRDECRSNGHCWTAVTPFGQQDPAFFFCDNCGRKVYVCEPNQPSAASERSGEV